MSSLSTYLISDDSEDSTTEDGDSTDEDYFDT